MGEFLNSAKNHHRLRTDTDEVHPSYPDKATKNDLKYSYLKELFQTECKDIILFKYLAHHDAKKDY
ncbi:MAG: hypothetical protein IPN89_05365 [Saprospiraceae bacterium]|nr:hypothetical protein [Saprospiraceae bacterium]